MEELIAGFAVLAGQPAGAVVAVGESSLSDIKTRPDYAITLHNALIGFIELKAPGKGADPRKFHDPHDREQWDKLKSLPNLIYTDGNAFSLWRDGKLEGSILRFEGDIETAGASLAATSALTALFGTFFQWQPIPPRNAPQLAEVSARLCRLLRDEVSEQLALGSKSLTSLAQDWRKLLFPQASDAVFADGYAQAVTFGLLMARAQGISLAEGLDHVARDLQKTNSLIGTALKVLTDQAENQATLKTSLATLTRVLDVVDWAKVSKGDPEAWLYFYERFLSVYDNDLRKKTGSYYTPPEIVNAMVRMVDDLLRDPNRFGLTGGLASPDVTLADPAMGTRVFQGVQQPVCIVIASRMADTDPETPARVRFHSLPNGRREEKFEAISKLSVGGAAWTDCPAEWRAPFLPAPVGAWASFPSLEDLFVYDGSGVMPGRTWVIAPDAASLRDRWDRLVHERDPEVKENLFHPHIVGGQPADKHSRKAAKSGLSGHEYRAPSVANDRGPIVNPTRYGFRSFDRQWVIPDNRLLNRSNPTLWKEYSGSQIYLTAPHDRSATAGAALTFTELIPDLHHYNGRGGRVFPLWFDGKATVSNIKPALRQVLSDRLANPVSGEDVFAYVAAIAAHPGYVARFKSDLVQPGLRIPITSDPKLFHEAVRLGRQIVWLHTFGERFVSAEEGRPPGPPRLPEGKAPRIPAAGAIPSAPDKMPNSISYDENKRRLFVGDGYIDNVAPGEWTYEVSGKQVLVQWFSYRRRDRERPIIGDRRQPSPLNDIQPDHWVAEYTTELMNVLNVLGRLVELEPALADLLDRICKGPLLSADSLRAEGAFDVPADFGSQLLSKSTDERQGELLE